MKPLAKGLLLAAIQLALVLGISGKFLYDRATRPRVWVRAGPFDPNLPIRGRYVRLQLLVPYRGSTPGRGSPGWAYLQPEGNQLVAEPAPDGQGVRVALRKADDETVAATLEPLAFFIPEHIADPSRRAPGEELWVEATLPKKGLPRPIRLGVKKEGVLTPLELR